MDPKLLDDLSRRLADAVPAGLKELKADLEKNFHGVLQSSFSRLELVGREEFEVQAAVLSRTRAKLEALERQVAELERQLHRHKGDTVKANKPGTDRAGA